MTHSTRFRREGVEFQIIGRNMTNASWNGAQMQLQQHASVNMPQTPNGSMVFVYMNQATMNNAGQLSLTSGGSQPVFLPAQALANAPSIYVRNWSGNNLGVTNTSAQTATPILIAAYGPGMPGQTPLPLPSNGTAVSLVTGRSAQGNALAQYMQLALQATTSGLTIMAVVGGPLDETGNNAYVIQLNAAANTGPGGGPAGPPPVTPAPDGYYATTTSNNYGFNFNWGAFSVYVVDLSPINTAAATVSMAPL